MLSRSTVANAGWRATLPSPPARQCLRSLQRRPRLPRPPAGLRPDDRLDQGAEGNVMNVSTARLH